MFTDTNNDKSYKPGQPNCKILILIYTKTFSPDRQYIVFSYKDYVIHQYVDNQHDIRPSFISKDYVRIRNICVFNKKRHSKLHIILYSNPFVYSQHPCFNVNAEVVDVHMISDPYFHKYAACFCNIEVSDKDGITKSTRNGTGNIYRNEQQTYHTETSCSSGNTVTHTQGLINMFYKNVTTISVIKYFEKSLVNSTYIVILLNNNKIKVLDPSNTWLPYDHDTNSSRMLYIQYLSLDYNILTHILPNAWYNIIFDHVSIRYNNLIKLSDKTFEHLDTRVLNLHHNYIQYISKEALKHIKHLQFLTLSSNRLYQLYSEQFPLTVNDVVLKDNNITQLSFNYQYIPQFDVSSNHIDALHYVTLGHEVIASKLTFHGNLITYIEEYAFQHYSQIDHLDLSNNHLNINFTKRYFNKYFKCIVLNLTYNYISSIEHIFYHSGFRRISEIDLSHNYIPKVINVNNYHQNVYVKRLHMAYNKITYISSTIFQNMVQLNYADFKGNKLHHFDMMPVMSQKLVVDLTENPIHCSCNLRWLKEMGLWHIYKVDFCKDLVYLRQVRVIDVPLEDFVCETPCTTEQCNCYGPHANHSSLTTHVTCSGRGLTEVPRPLPSLIQLLDLSNNMISHINMFQKYSRLNTLILSYNGISSLDFSKFNLLLSLKRLILNNHQLEYISFDDKLHLSFLEVLSLNNNKIRYIEINARLSESLPALQRIDIRENNLPYINKSVCEEFIAMNTLHTIKLSGNNWDCSSCSALYFRFCLANNYCFFSKVSDMWKWRCGTNNSNKLVLSVD